MEQGIQKANQQSRLADWARRVEACRKSGQKTGEWCAEQGIAESTYYKWQRKVYRAALAEREECFVEVPVRSVRGEVTASIQSGELRIEIHAGADVETIRELVRAVKEC